MQSIFIRACALIGLLGSSSLAAAQSSLQPIGSPFAPVGKPIGSPPFQTLRFDSKPSPFGAPAANIGAPIDPSLAVAPILMPNNIHQESYFSRFLRGLAGIVPFSSNTDNQGKWTPGIGRRNRKRVQAQWGNPD